MLKAALILAPTAAEYVRVPGGFWMHEDCINEVPNGELTDVPECPHPTYSADEWAPNGESPNVQCYDQKAYITSSTEFTELNATFVVPPLPSTAARQVVYLWPGFKATEPQIGRPVLQPVLQYGQHGAKWQLQSWAVGVPAGSITAPAISVSPGDSLVTYMQLNGDTWTVYGRNDNTGEESNLSISKRHAGNQLYTNAVFVSENVMARNHCDYYPANKGVEFTAVSANGKAPGQWQNGYDCGDPDCGQETIQNSDGSSVQLTWNPDSQVV